LLEEIRLLANIESASEKLLSIVLAGQPELAARLSHPSLRQLKQRIGLRCSLAPLDLSGTLAYIAARVRIAGGEAPQLFTPAAVNEIHSRSGGIPRTISVICDNALVSGFALDRKQIDRDLILEVCADFDFAVTDADDSAADPLDDEAAEEEVAVAVRKEAQPVAGASDAPGDGLLTRLSRIRRMSRLSESADRTRN
jgi:general secretion pathway protein A